MSAGPSPVHSVAPPRRGALRLSQAQWVVVSMVLGVAVGYACPSRGADAHGFQAADLGVLSTIFLRMIKSLIVPLIFSTLVVGIAGHGDDLKKVGRLAVRSILYFEVVTTLALVVGLVAVNVVRPGVGIHLGDATARTGSELATARPTFAGVVEHIVPTSFFKAAADNEVLQIVFFAIIFAVGLSQVQGPAKAAILTLCEHVSEVMFKFVGIVMRFAPFGIGGAIAVTVGTSGLGVLRNLGALVLTLYGSLVVFALVVLLPIALVARVPLRRFVRAIEDPLLIAFSTSSSEAALPLALQRLEAFGVPRRIAAFVMPTGYTFNMDGTSLYLTLASVFVAQAAGIDMPIGTQILMMLTLMLTSKGVAAVPRASLVILSGALTQFNLPLAGIAVILGVDALMDMARTSVNLVGNCLATVVMARWEGELDRSPMEIAVTGQYAVTSPECAEEMGMVRVLGAMP